MKQVLKQVTAFMLAIMMIVSLINEYVYASETTSQEEVTMMEESTTATGSLEESTTEAEGLTETTTEATTEAPTEATISTEQTMQDMEDNSVKDFVTESDAAEVKESTKETTEENVVENSEAAIEVQSEEVENVGYQSLNYIGDCVLHQELYVDCYSDSFTVNNQSVDRVTRGKITFGDTKSDKSEILHLEQSDGDNFYLEGLKLGTEKVNVDYTYEKDGVSKSGTQTFSVTVKEYRYELSISNFLEEVLFTNSVYTWNISLKKSYCRENGQYISETIEDNCEITPCITKDFNEPIPEDEMKATVENGRLTIATSNKTGNYNIDYNVKVDGQEIQFDSTTCWSSFSVQSEYYEIQYNEELCSTIYTGESIDVPLKLKKYYKDSSTGELSSELVSNPTFSIEWNRNNIDENEPAITESIKDSILTLTAGSGEGYKRGSIIATTENGVIRRELEVYIAESREYLGSSNENMKLCMIKTLTIKSKKIKSVGKNALKGTAKNLVIKVPKSKKSLYAKLFKGKGNNTVKIK